MCSSGGRVASLPHSSHLLQFPSLHECFSSAQVRSYFAGMDPVHDDHGGPHDQSVEDVQEVLVHHDVSGSALRILDHADNRSHEDQNADDIKREHMLLPRCSVAAGSGLFAEARVEDGGCDDEKAEDDDLDDETGDDDVVAHIAIVGAVCGSKKAGTCVVVLAFVRSHLD
jgi:hypothetical protein